MPTSLIPLFPLGTVLFPGAPLALHIFEDRYRTLMADLLAVPEADRSFGVITIRSGREVGVDGVNALHDVGCMAVITQVTGSADGTFDLQSVGTQRFRILTLDSELPYLRATVEWLPEPTGNVGALNDLVAERYAAYRDALGGIRGVAFDVPEVPSDARLLSYLVAATVIAENRDKQRFLAEYDAAGRLAAEARWLTVESMLLRELSAVPAGRLLDAPASPN
ncbi:MAG: LON peptidase substrate-binding domain-containing protein [Frankiaceae bacterium]|nr:LON peptidase substrate-binding domain-containing protein [Frankiaceae bacterium]